MAEVAPLNSAHDHARKAAVELRHAHHSQASHEHQQASTDFARAARGTSDIEALRILRLLEEQHQRLARIVRTQDKATESSVEDIKIAAPDSASKDATSTSSPSEKATTTKGRRSASALTGSRIGSQARDSSPSLARDIATRRGIPQSTRTQSSAAAHARARQLSPESQRRVVPANAPKVPPSIVDSQANLRRAKKTIRDADDAGFNSFYANLTTGTMSKLSSVLAYAGLPLTAEDSAKLERTSNPKSEKQRATANDDPDVTKIFSKASLEAVEDKHRQRGTFGRGFGPAESFYVVPTGGGTFSYADIAKPPPHHLSGVTEEEEAEFVDAREVPGPASPSRSRLSSRSKRGSFGNTRTQEELELENTTLKQSLEQVAKRLAGFEAHAQDASMAALTQSVANLRPGGSGGGAAGGTANDQALQNRLRQMERQLMEKDEERQKMENSIREAVEERQKYEVLAQRQAKDLKKWDHKYADLKKGAKEKHMKAKRESVDAPTAIQPAGDGVVGD